MGIEHQPANQAVVGVEARRRRVMEMYLRGVTMRPIAKELGVAVSTVALDLKAVRDVWRDEMAEEYEVWKDRELERVDRVEAAAWQGWERSLQDAVKTTEKTGGEGGAENTITAEGQAGDASFLNVIDKCIGQRCRILGLYAPVKSDVGIKAAVVKYVFGVDPDRI